MEAVIPPRKNRKVLREYDRYLYKLRHLVENAFLHLKRWRGIATRYVKNSAFLPRRSPHPLYRFMGSHLVTTLSSVW